MTSNIANISQVAWGIVALPAFVLFWCAIVWLIGAWGWREVAGHYPDRPVTTTWSWWCRSIRFAWGANYGNCVNISTSASGIRLSVLPLFRIGHPPIFIPWSDLCITRSAHWYGTVVQLKPRRTSRAILLSARLADSIAAQVGTNWPKLSHRGHFSSPIP